MANRGEYLPLPRENTGSGRRTGTRGMKNGDIVFSKNGVPSVKRYLDEVEGQAVSDLW